MKIAVCVKWVPVVARMKFDVQTKRVVRDGVPNEVNPYDLLALQRAVELKETHGAEISVYTMGPPHAREALVRCLAQGADFAFHIVDPVLAGSDTLATARTLSLAIQRESYDLILFGYYSVDAETGQVGPEVAEFLGLPQITSAQSLDLRDSGWVWAQRIMEDGTQDVECRLPAVVSVTEGVAPEIFPTIEEIRNAESREIIEIAASELSSDPSIFGAAGSPTWVSEIQIVESTRQQQLIEDEPMDRAAAIVVEFLKSRKLLDGDEQIINRAVPTVHPIIRPSEGPSVWVISEVGDHGVKPVSKELLGAAQEIADSISGHVTALLIGGDGIESNTRELGECGADEVIVIAHQSLQVYTTEPYAATLTEMIRQEHPYAVLIASTVNGRDMAARVAARLELGLTGDCIGLHVDESGRLVQLKPAFGGNIVAPILSYTKPYMATVRPGILEVFQPVGDRDPRVRAGIPIFTADPALRVITTRRDADGESGDLDDARAVICIGKGVGSQEAIDELDSLASLLKAQYICTRDVSDEGWMSKQRQVGITGRSIAPDLYIGVGVRGDFNHTVGIQRVGTVIAVNNNRRASIFKQADIGVLADWREFIPALVAALELQARQQ